MQKVIDIITEYQLYIVIALILLVLILIILVIIAYSSLNKVEKRYRRLMRGTNNKSLEELLIQYLENAQEAVKISSDIKAESEYIKSQLVNCLQKVAIKRYKAFEDIGSDLSYSIALLDNKDDGVILTGIYGRNETTSYAKPIDKGISRYDLSEEEKTVLKDAMNQ